MIVYIDFPHFEIRRPNVLRKRKEIVLDDDAQLKQVEINSEATGIELHKDSKYIDK